MKPGDVIAFPVADVLPADDPLSEWCVLLAMALNDIALVNERLERDYDSLHDYLYWLRLGVTLGDCETRLVTCLEHHPARLSRRRARLVAG